MMGWVTVVLWLDADGSLALQRLLGALTWLVMGVVLTRVTPGVRFQTAVVIAFATLVEYIFSPTLEIYIYRFDNVPAYVPPAHGLVYLSAYALGHSGWVCRRKSACTTAILALGGLWAAHGLLFAERTDVLGAFWFACLAGFLAWGPSKPVYLGAFVVVSYLELLGTELGNWQWQTVDPTGLVSIGNPPSGAAGGYGWFDLAGLLAAPYLLRLWEARGTTRRERTRPPAPVDERRAL